MTELLHHFTDWYLSTLSQGGYWLIAGLMALESTLVPIPSEVIVPPAAYLAHTQGQFSFLGVVLAGTAGSCVGASVMYWAARLLGYPVIVRFGRYAGLGQGKLELAEHWCAHYGPPGVFLSRLLPAIRHLIGIPTGILRMDFRRYALATVAGSLVVVNDYVRRRDRYRELHRMLVQWDKQLDLSETWHIVLRIATTVEKALLAELIEWRSHIRNQKLPQK